MSVTSMLRNVLRVDHKYAVVHITQSRTFTAAEAVNALRPFYFAVHPDFFGQHPKEREVNENSLKRLNGYIENLQKPGSRSVRPTNLTFYVRNTNAKTDKDPLHLPSGFRSVSFTLQTKDVLSTVMNVLQSCSLSVDHMQVFEASIKCLKSSSSCPEKAKPFYRPIRWDKSYYTFTGYRDPEDEHAKNVEPSLSLWLRENHVEARHKQMAGQPRRDELLRLKEQLIQKLGLSDIRWQRCWGMAHRCCQLQSLSRLAMQNPEVLHNLSGHTILFSDQSGMNASGYVMLGTMDVHHHWSKLFERLPSYRALFQQTEWLKERISLLLGGVQVIHVEQLGPVLPLEDHYSTLSHFHKKLLPLRLTFHPRSLHGLSMALETGRSSISLHEMGHFIIPVTSDPLQLCNFLQQQSHEARLRIQNRDQLETDEKIVLKTCLRDLSLAGLSKEPSISTQQMILCCRRLLEARFPLMQGLRFRITHFYSVMQDGDICIPWEWNG